jgi:LPS export ABC transporter protein LptC
MIREMQMLCFAAAILLAMLLSCESADNDGRSVGAQDVPDQEFSDFTTVESDSGVVKWILSAPVARVYNASKLIVTDDPRIEFYNEDGTLASVLIARKGEYNQVTHDLTALGSVVVTSVDGYTLETESLIWVETVEEIHTEDFVRFTKGEDVLTGYGFRSDPNLENVEIFRDVKALLRDDEGIVEEEVKRETDEREEPR